MRVRGRSLSRSRRPRRYRSRASPRCRLSATTEACSRASSSSSTEPPAASVFDYSREDFTRSGSRYDLVFDNAGNRSWLSMRRALAPNGMVVLVGGPRKLLLGPLGHVIRITLASKLGARKAVFFIAKPGSDDLMILRDLIEAGQVTPAIERRFELGQIAEAMRAMDGHARAKIVITV